MLYHCFSLFLKQILTIKLQRLLLLKIKKRKHCGSSGDYQKLESRIISSCCDSVFDSVTDCRETSMYLRRNIPYFKRENTALKIPIQITKTFVVVKLITFENFIRLLIYNIFVRECIINTLVRKTCGRFSTFL